MGMGPQMVHLPGAGGRGHSLGSGGEGGGRAHKGAFASRPLWENPRGRKDQRKLFDSLLVLSSGFFLKHDYSEEWAYRQHFQ